MRDEYTVVHRSAKLIVAVLVTGLMLLSRKTGYFTFETLAIFSWFFGPNVVGYLIEAALHLKHKHSKF